MIRSLPPQSVAIYQELSKGNHMTAKKLGSQLGIYPQAAYRAIKPLKELGVVEQIGRYPRKYRIRASEDSLETYLQLMQEYYIKTFLPKKGGIKTILAQLLKVTFIQNRDELLQKSNEDIQKAKYRVDNIVSGDEVPAETILVRKNAIAKGVKFRFIVQKFDKFNRYMFTNWQTLGVKVRYYPVLEARLIVIDAKIVYITSYNPSVNGEAVGVRFEYPPIAKLMQELFENRWSQAKEIT